jgi:hypothetical protein
VNPIFRAAVDLQEFCVGHQWRFCVIGAVAVQRWGEPRLTQDVDLTILTGFGSEERWIDALLERFEARRPDARDFALGTRVVLLRAGNGIPVDVSLGALPFEERVVGRASRHHFASGVDLVTCSAEDLVVLKAFANRDKDWLDVSGVILRQGKRLDASLIWAELRPLVELKEEPEILSRLAKLLPLPETPR